MKFALKALSLAVLGAASTFTFAEAPASEAYDFWKYRGII